MNIPLTPNTPNKGAEHRGSGKYYTLTSLRKFMTKYREQLNIPYVLHASDLREDSGITYLPFYMTPLL